MTAARFPWWKAGSVALALAVMAFIALAGVSVFGGAL